MRSEPHRRRHRRHHRRDKSRHHGKSRKERGEGKDDIPSPLRPPAPPSAPSSTSVAAPSSQAAPPSQTSPQPPSASAVMKERQKEDKESGEMTSTNQGKINASGEAIAQGKSTSQVGPSSSSPRLPPRDSQKVESRGSQHQLPAFGKNELLQELCVTQCIRDGYEISRVAYTTCFPVSKKPNFIYLPHLRFIANNKENHEEKKSAQRTGADLSQKITPAADIHQNHATPDLSKRKNFMMDIKISHFIQNLNECCLALQKARKNISSLKLLMGGEELKEIRKYDTDTKAIINELKYLLQYVDKKFET
uniref:Uncharacterized protein n=1 Tax=Setaria digitata TaxID=48799 RepID=A0A915PJY2_9BILA